MTFKKITTVVFLFYCLQNFSQTNPPYNLLWKIEGNGLKKPSYLFGTMHVRDSRAFNFSDSVLVSLEHCEAFAMEIHPDTMMSDVFKGIIDGKEKKKEETDLKELLSESDYQKLDEKFKDEIGYSIETLKIKNPIVIKSMLNRTKVKTTDRSTFVDAYLLGISKTMNKRVYGLEKTKDQLDFLNSLSKESLKQQYLDIIYSDSENPGSSLNMLIETYAKGNIDEIGKKVKLLYLADSAMVLRNKTMAKSMSAIMPNTSLFTAVGVAHLPGKEGVIQLLRNQGYRVSPVAASFTGIAKNYSIDPSKIKWQTVVDTVNGFSIESPGAFMDLNMVADLETKFYYDLTNIVSYGYYVINMSHSKTDLNEKKMIDEIISTYKKNPKYSLEKVKHLTRDGISIKELLIKTGEENSLRLRLFIRDNIIYGFFYGGEQSKMQSPEADRFFDSFKALPLQEQKESKWIEFKNEEGAFSIGMPSEPKLNEQEVLAENGEVYKIKMYISTNVANMTNYLLRYNDHPSQMYIDDRSGILSGTIDEIGLTNRIVSGPDTIWKDGFEGRKFACMIQDKYYTEARLFIRGNRTYFLLKQNLVPNANNVLVDDFFESFKFTPYKRSDKYILAPDGQDFEMLLPAKPKIVIDSTASYDGNLDNTIDYYATNPNSGGLYHFEYSNLGDYFKIKTLTEFYKEYKTTLVTYADSLASSDSIMVDGYYGYEYLITKQKEENFKRIRIWIAGNKLFYIASYVAKDELFNEENNLIYNSLKHRKEPEKFDIYASKTDKLLGALMSTDSTVYKKALGAFYYYKFENYDLSKLVKALGNEYHDDTLDGGARSKIIGAIGALKDTMALPILVREFKNRPSSQTKLSALLAITEIDRVRGLPIYLQLLSSEKLKANVFSSWKLYSPLSDSMELTKQHFDQVVKLLDSSNSRNNILGLGYTFAEQDSTGNFLTKYFPGLIKYAYDDLAHYLESKKNATALSYNPEIYNYIRLMDRSGQKDIIDKFTAQLLSQSDIINYYETEAVAVRIKHHLPVEKKILKKHMDDLGSRERLLNSYESIGEFESLSSKYTKPQEIGKMLLYSYVSSESDYPQKIKLLGKTEMETGTFYVYTYKIEDDETEYLGVSGPFVEKSSKKLEDYYAVTNFEAKEKDWKAQAKRLIGEY